MENPVPPNAKSATRSHVVTIDGLRGLSIALVLAYHFWPGWSHPAAIAIVPRTGWIAVDLFFLISGFSIFYPYARSIVDGLPEQTIRTFALRRFAKIYPSYALSLVAITLLGWSMTGYHDIGFQLLTHAFFVHSFFEETINGINGPAWSLALEAQFYVLFALTSRLAMRAPLAYGVTLIAIGFAYRLGLATIAHLHTGWLETQLPGVLDFFGGGILLAYAYRSIVARRPDLVSRRSAWTALCAGCTLGLYALLFAIKAIVDVPTAPHVLAALVRAAEMPLFFGIAVGAFFGVPSVRAIIASRASLYLAAISYNLYLWHQGIFIALLHVAGPWVAHSSIVSAGVALVATAVSIGVAHVLTYSFEQPIRLRLQSVEGRRALAA